MKHSKLKPSSHSLRGAQPKRSALQLAILDCLRQPSGASERMMTTLELLADKRLSSFWFLRMRLYTALGELIEDGEVAIVQKDIITPERGFVPRSYYAIVERRGSKTT